jgi:hypothetical protein
VRRGAMNREKKKKRKKREEKKEEKGKRIESKGRED